MDESARKKVVEERDGVVALLETIADRLQSLAPSQAWESLLRLAAPLAELRHEAEPLLGPLPEVRRSVRGDDDRNWSTVFFVRRGSGIGA